MLIDLDSAFDLNIKTFRRSIRKATFTNAARSNSRSRRFQTSEKIADFKSVDLESVFSLASKYGALGGEGSIRPTASRMTEIIPSVSQCTAVRELGFCHSSTFLPLL